MSAPAPARRALLVLGGGPRRAALAAALADAGWQVETADEPYGATARFVDAPCDLVAMSLRRFRRQDGAFLEALRARHPRVRILVLVPPKRRAAAAKALAAGADAQIPEPCYAEEFVAAVRALFRRASSPAPTDEGLRLLAGEVAHAINNPLQILSLIGEADGLPAARAHDVRAGVGRIRAVTRILVAFGALRTPQPAEHDLAALVRDALSETQSPRPVADVRGPPARVHADGDQVRAALRSMAAYLGGVVGDGTAALQPSIEAVNGHDPGAVFAIEGPAWDPATRDQAVQSVVMVRDETRAVFPGLKIAATVAQLNGGALETEQDGGTLRVALRLPAAR